MEINPKCVFSGESAEIKKQNSIKKKQQKNISGKNGENIVKSPANPSFYSNYIGIHKTTSFGNSTPTTKESRTEYLKGIKTQEGKSLFDEKSFEDENGFGKKISENEEAFEFFKTLYELRYDNGERVCRGEQLENLADISTMFSQEQKEKFELFDVINTEIRADEKLKDFLELFINLKDDRGKYKYNFESIIGSLYMAYICIPEDVGADEIKSIYDSIEKADEESSSPKLDTNSVFELMIYKFAVNKDFDIKQNMGEIKNQLKSGINPMISASAIDLEPEQRNIFDRLTSYKDENERIIFPAETSYQIAKNNKDPEALFTSLDKLHDLKKSDGTPLFQNYILCKILNNGDDVCKRAEKIGEIEDIDVREAVALLYDLPEILKSEETFNRVIKLYEQKDKDGVQLLNIMFIDPELLNDTETSNRFIKYASKLSQSGVSKLNISNLIKDMSDEQCERIIELGKIAREPDGSSSFGYNTPDVYVKDEETFELAKKFFGMRNQDGKMTVSIYTLQRVLAEGKEYADRFLRCFELLESIGEIPSTSSVEHLVKDEEAFKKAELFKGIKGKNGKKLLTYYDLCQYSDLEYEQAQRMAKLLALKTPDGDDIILSSGIRKEITEGNKEDYENILKYAPLLCGIKSKSGNRLFTDGKELTNCAKGGEKVYSRAKQLSELTTKDGKPLINNYNIPRLSQSDDDTWNRLQKVISAKNSLGEHLFSEDSTIISVISCENFDEVLKKAEELSELRNPENKEERLLTDWGISETAKQDKNFREKLTEYAPKLMALKNLYGKPIIRSNNLHNFVINTDMSLDNLVKYISIFANVDNKGIDRNTFSEKNIITALQRGEEYCEEAIKCLKEISAKKTPNNSDYVDMSRFDSLLGQDIDDIKEYKRKLDRFDEFKDYPSESNLCLRAGALATLKDEELDEIFKFARLKDSNSKPFFTCDEVISITNCKYFNSNLSSVRLLRELSDEEKGNLQETIDKICALKDSMCEKSELYVNGHFENQDEAKAQIDYMFSQHKGALIVLTNVFDKETINNIMRLRTAHATEIFDTIGSFGKEQIDLLKRLVNSTNQDGKPFMPAQKIQFINILSAYQQNNFPTTEIEEMLESGKVDIGKLEFDLLKNIIRQTKISEETLSQIPPEKIYAWNSPYLHLLVNDMAQDYDMREFFVNSLTKNFDEYILDTNNDYGRANAKTKELFEKEGLNYQAWVKPNEDLEIDFVSRDKNAQSMLQISEQIQEDIEELRKTPAKKFIDKQLSKYIKEDKFTVPTNCQMSKSLLTEFTQNTIKQLNSVWERAQKNAESEDPERSAKAQNTLTILSHLEQRIKDIERTPDVNFSKNLDLTIKMWDRKPEYDIFQGNYSTCCIGIGNFNSSAMPHYLMNTAYNFIEIKNNHTGKTIGNALCYLIKDGNGKPAFVIDNIEIDNASKPSNEIGIEIRNKMAEYASKVAKEITGKDDTPVYMSSHYNDVATDDLKSEKQKIEFLGDIDTEKIYMDLYDGWINSKEQLNTETNVLRLK